MEYYRRLELPAHLKVQVLITISIISQAAILGSRGIIIPYKSKKYNAENNNSEIAQKIFEFQCSLNIPAVQ